MGMEFIFHLHNETSSSASTPKFDHCDQQGFWSRSTPKGIEVFSTVDGLQFSVLRAMTKKYVLCVWGFWSHHLVPLDQEVQALEPATYEGLKMPLWKSS